MEQCDELSSREGYAAVERFQLTPGGAVSNTAMQLASLGVTVEAMTVLGNDDFGRLLREAWRQAGVRADKFVQLTDDAPTSCAALPVYKADSKRAVYACPGSNTTIDGEMLLPRAPNGGPDYAMLAAHKFFVLGYPHIMPKLQGSSLRAFLVAVARHCAVALDVNEAYDHPQLPLGPRGRGTAEGKEVFAPVAVLHCNLEEAAACLNRKAVRHAVQIDQAFHCV
jgi:sugar/nucleoside kinase (ribokinase family)